MQRTRKQAKSKINRTQRQNHLNISGCVTLSDETNTTLEFPWSQRPRSLSLRAILQSSPRWDLGRAEPRCGKAMKHNWKDNDGTPASALVRHSCRTLNWGASGVALKALALLVGHSCATVCKRRPFADSEVYVQMNTKRG